MLTRKTCNLLRAAAADVLAFRAGHAPSLRRVSSARVPLRGATNSEVVAFRDDLGDVWSLIRIGQPDLSGTVPVRLHSACLTGDVFASLRCDCGDQLHQALDVIAKEGCGVLVYLPQEGRGIGLAQKIKAYALQEDGFDTVEANHKLGFKADMRDYGVGIQILKDLGLHDIRLLTNNPKKTEAFNLRGFDLTVVDQVPIISQPNAHNASYLATKRDKMGHTLP